MTPEATETKAIGADSHKGCVLEAEVDVGRAWHLGPTCDASLTDQKVRENGYDSVTFDPGDGPEYIVYSSRRVLSVRRYVGGGR
eukprot:CAMPEP_0204559872 /NCGR_PEP_ID=MMETSP0661-20131031/32280_1 /ASSEMBLY_ACC=CAM_ASM_000606 /TAXON_ID=109239 /ORGANISM="Alexandrium margalefi, Strain AMGDE01CS-322" /LENGTH=83 /DNA_ID=CAMNT_0051567145 /DNA_START=63 /DNA_END=314 /DNA_ORIENTATION=-